MVVPNHVRMIRFEISNKDLSYFLPIIIISNLSSTNNSCTLQQQFLFMLTN